jgi:hypothetical protein
MRAWGFKNQTDAQRLRESLANHSGKVADSPDFLSSRGLVCLSPSGGIPARSGSDCGKASCQVFTINDDDELVAFATNSSSALMLDVWNIETVAVPAGQYFTVIDIFGRPVVQFGAGNGRIFGFRLTTLIEKEDTSASATIFELSGNVFGRSLGTHTIYDPAQWYGRATIGTRGICQYQDGMYYAKQSSCSQEEYL